ncbi:MAG: CoA transferase [Deltaproteobacteria bacterium]|nr:CoA transferase [Deltaproteobacteria bacterium]
MFLKGYRLIDMCWLGPGPFVSQLLGDLGFDVIRVSEVAKGAGRRGGKDIGTLLSTHNAAQLGAFRLGMRNTRGIAVDLKTPDGQRVFRRLVEKADALQEGFRPGVVERLGIAYDDVRKIKPDIVYASITGYGQTGPMRESGGHDLNYGSVSGFIRMNARRDAAPAIPGALIGDFAAGGMSAAIHILTALLRRGDTGKGAYCDVSITDALFHINSMTVGSYLLSGEEPRPGESFFSGMWPWYDVYETKDGQYVAVGAVEPYFYENLCRTLEREDLIDQQWSFERREQTRTEFGELFGSKTRDEWVALSEGVNACFTPVPSTGEAAEDPQMQARNMVVEVDHPVDGRVRIPGSMMKLDDAPLEIDRWTLSPGQYTDEILDEHDFSKGEIAELREKGAVA